MNEITVIIDHNKIQSDTLLSLVNDLGDLEAKLSAFGWYVTRCDGHDLQALSDCLEECKAITDRPQIIIADTIKGQGVSFMEDISTLDLDNLYQFHSGAPSAEDYTRANDELLASASEQLHKLGAGSLESEQRSLLPRPIVEDPQRLIAAYSMPWLSRQKKDQSLSCLMET